MKYLSFIISLTLIQAFSAQTKYYPFNGNVFSIDLPEGFEVKEPYSDNNLDHEEYEVTKKGVKFMTINSLLASRFTMGSISNIHDRYLHILENQPEITYKIQKANWFTVSGVDPETGNVFYWKKIWQGEYVCDLYIEYPKTRKSEIEPYLGTIAKSFMIYQGEEK